MPEERVPTIPRLPGLDGLRAIAVVLVTGFHLETKRFMPGGFIGVDLVISFRSRLVSIFRIRSPEGEFSQRSELAQMVSGRPLNGIGTGEPEPIGTETVRTESGTEPSQSPLKPERLRTRRRTRTETGS